VSTKPLAKSGTAGGRRGTLSNHPRVMTRTPILTNLWNRLLVVHESDQLSSPSCRPAGTDPLSPPPPDESRAPAPVGSSTLYRIYRTLSNDSLPSDDPCEKGFELAHPEPVFDEAYRGCFVLQAPSILIFDDGEMTTGAKGGPMGKQMCNQAGRRDSAAVWHL
jgi:hypothetical protein